MLEAIIAKITMRKFKDKAFRPRGFTLLEIIIVVVIIGILAGLAIPRYQKSMEQARMAEAFTMLRVIRDAQMRYATTSNSDEYANVPTLLDINITGDTGKFFYFDVLAAGVIPDPVNTNINETLSMATRRTNVAYIGSDPYYIYITETGEFWYQGVIPYGVVPFVGNTALQQQGSTGE